MENDKERWCPFASHRMCDTVCPMWSGKKDEKTGMGILDMSRIHVDCMLLRNILDMQTISFDILAQLQSIAVAFKNIENIVRRQT